MTKPCSLGWCSRLSVLLTPAGDLCSDHWHLWEKFVAEVYRWDLGLLDKITEQFRLAAFTLDYKDMGRF